MIGVAPDTAVLWTHALAAFLFGALAVAELRRDAPAGQDMRGRSAFIVALSLTALWALAVAGIDAGDVATRLAEGVRNVAWLAFMLVLVRRAAPGGRTAPVGLVYGAVIAVIAMAMALAVVQAMVGAETSGALESTRLAMRIIAALGALLLLHQFAGVVGAGERRGIRLVAVALAAMWGIDLILYATAYASGAWPTALIEWRGVVMIVAAPALAVAVHRDGAWTLSVSRTVAVQSLSAAGIALYALTMALATGLIGQYGGEHARIVQTAFVFGSTAALLTLVSTPWTRAWAKVVVAKHLFTHRYDYRAEWLRFTSTLGQPGDGAAPLDCRVVKAIADMTDSPGGMLMVADGAGLAPGARWNWDSLETKAAPGDALAAHLAATARIVEIDAVRTATTTPDEIAAVPAWLLACPDAWAIVPLIHLGRLAGAIVLARPLVDRRLDWEDFDLLGVAGRQVASYLAEDRAHEALAEAARFDEFNRRFAFIMHDLKNMVSQLTLVARNAQRHSDNPAFRADMVATLKDSSDRMNALLARLSQHHGGTGATGQPMQHVALMPLVERVAAARRAQHPIACTGDADAAAIADPVRVEQILLHLVQNAIEASDPGDPVTLHVTGATIAVIDRGCGMTDSFARSRLFKPFVSTKPGGFGIGAFEARQLAEAMDGTLSVETGEGAGTRFCLTLRTPAALPTLMDHAA